MRTLLLCAALAAGLGLGWLFYQGLWWTIRRGLASAHPATWFVLSLALRLGLAVGGVLIVAQGDWHRLLACLTGFVIARSLVSWRVRAPLMPAMPSQAVLR